MNGIRATKAGRGEHWLIGGETTTIKVSGRETTGEMLVLETFVPPGGDPPALVEAGQRPRECGVRARVYGDSWGPSYVASEREARG